MMSITKVKRILVVFAGLVTFLGAAAADSVPRDEPGFTQFVATQLLGQLSDAEIIVKGPLTLGVGDLQANLDRIFAFCHGNSEGCLAQIDKLRLRSGRRVRVAPLTRRAGRLPGRRNGPTRRKRIVAGGGQLRGE